MIKLTLSRNFSIRVNPTKEFCKTRKHLQSLFTSSFRHNPFLEHIESAGVMYSTSLFDVFGLYSSKPPPYNLVVPILQKIRNDVFLPYVTETELVNSLITLVEMKAKVKIQEFDEILSAIISKS